LKGNDEKSLKGNLLIQKFEDDKLMINKFCYERLRLWDFEKMFDSQP